MSVKEAKPDLSKKWRKHKNNTVVDELFCLDTTTMKWDVVS